MIQHLSTSPGRSCPSSPQKPPVLGDRVLSVSDAVAAVKEAGFKTNASAASLYSMVAIALTRGGRFRRVTKGKYKAR